MKSGHGRDWNSERCEKGDGVHGCDCCVQFFVVDYSGISLYNDAINDFDNQDDVDGRVERLGCRVMSTYVQSWNETVNMQCLKLL